MSLFVRGLILLLLTLAAWKGHEVRDHLARGMSGDAVWASSMQASLDALPLELSGRNWTGTREDLDLSEVWDSGAECAVQIRYARPDGQEVILYVAGSSHFDERMHSPNFCMMAQGWEQRSYAAVPFFDLPGEDDSATMGRLVSEYGHHQMLTFFWLMAGGRISEPKWGQRIRRFLDLLAGRSSGTNLLVVVYVPVRKDLDGAEVVGAEFVKAVYPALQATAREKEP